MKTHPGARASLLTPTMLPRLILLAPPVLLLLLAAVELDGATTRMQPRGMLARPPSINSARREGKKGKKKKGYGKYIVMAGISKAVMLYFMIHAVAAIAGKALIVAKVALAIATALALKKSSGHKTSYEIVKHPEYSHTHTHSTSVDYDHGGGGGGYEGGSRRKRRARR
ncbi:hypothetical protein QAD02_020145 [Eretmocerus hayati]|uniref:Uncharacterized protein n=1 Tax=Eretmocerus hayati TaxID=131215 RepID=A0ACC2PLN2_9HYME|nr:hypothetical protein QAD02_020145 [Eretmocerus hayati]